MGAPGRDPFPWLPVVFVVVVVLAAVVVISI